MADFDTNESAVIVGGTAAAFNESLSTTTRSPLLATSEVEGITLFKFVSLGVIIAFGSAGNVVVIYALTKNLRHRRGSPYVLMIGFVSLDLLRVFLCFPVILITVMHRLQWRYGRELCQLMAFFNLFCLFGNALTLLAMAIDSYIATRYKGFHRRKFKGCLGTTILLTAWAVAFLFAFPAVYGLRSFQFLPIEAQCNLPHHYYENNLEVVGLLLFLIGVFILTNFVYCKLVGFLRKRRRMRPIFYDPAVSDNWSFFEGGDHPRQRWLATYLSVSAVPLSVIERPYLHHYHHHHHHHRHHPHHGANLQEIYFVERRRVHENLMRVSFIVNVLFAAMWSPYIMVCLWYAFQNPTGAAPGQSVDAAANLAATRSEQNLPEWIEISATWLTYFQVAVTPLAFFTLTGITRSDIQGNGTGRSGRSRHVTSERGTSG